ncbi:HTH-type transcriptional activator RhaS [bioreactor metagenome]|uniref:HTH-type transcriptional activator RhaS n=1 Tax=bioreactor metagenome TaxID=1076179 RepID=A0A645B7L3_9ZZZZ|nr:helix-turn-helix domain-containing protein [Proteiniphilum sp.]MEA4918572.1 helix-turn-helix domain-containing protein [Proteiniphilum sp.]
MKRDIQFYDYYSLHGSVNSKSYVENFFIFDDINSFTGGFHSNTIINYPIRLGMAVAIICRKGHMKLRIGLEDFVVEKDMALIILPEQIFQLAEISSDFQLSCILFENSFFDIQNDFKIALDLQNYFFRQPCIKLPDKEMKEIMTIFELIKEKIEENRNLFLKEIVQTYIRILFYNVCNILFKSKEKGIKTRKEEIFEEFISLLSQNFRKEQNIGWYAGKFSLTPKYLSKLIYEVSGKHAGEWIRDYVILEARALLKSSSLTVQQISDELGFSNQSHFGSYFKRYTGVSPRKYKYIRKE